MPSVPRRRFNALAFLLFYCGTHFLAVGAEPSRADAEFFERTIRPLLADHCWACHGETGKPKGGLRLTSRSSILAGGDSGPAVVAGDPGGSLLMGAVRYDHEPKMPPKGPLKGTAIASLERWIMLGLPWPETTDKPSVIKAEPGVASAPDPDRRRFWSFEPVKPVNVPAADRRCQGHSVIDRFVIAMLEKKGLVLAPPAGRRTLIRRATFDLIGLPPTPAEVDAFLEDQSPLAFARVVDRLLASPRYGERWGRHWLDVVRYADARDLIQLPADSDFREAWRYRDWVVQSFNRDLPYTEFVRSQVAGDLLPPAVPGGINTDGLVATGMLAIADFVPGDVDKDTMIADYVNDQIDVVSKAFLGLSIACARCHDHKFDPLSIDDYYAMAGIFFSTRLIPGPVPGNTPLIRVPLLSETDLKKRAALAAADQRRRDEIERQLANGVDRAYLEVVDQILRSQVAAYLIAASELRQPDSRAPRPNLSVLARARGLDGEILAGSIAYLERVNAESTINHHPTIRAAASGVLAGPRLVQSADELQREIAAVAKRRTELDLASPDAALTRSCLVRLSGDDWHLVSDRERRINLWPNRGRVPADAMLTAQGRGPVSTKANINGHPRNVAFFDGNALLELPGKVPLAGSLFAVYHVTASGNAGQRLIGWEDSDRGQHGLGLITEPDGRLHAVVRKDGASGDVVDNRSNSDFQLVSLTWGPRGTTLHKNGMAAASQAGIDGVSSDPAIMALRIGGPGSGKIARFQGEIAAIRVYDRELDDNERQRVEHDLHAAWFESTDGKPTAGDSLTDLLDELRSAHGPFWPGAKTRERLLPESARSRLAALRAEHEDLKRQPAFETPRAVVVQDGGPKGTRHEGFNDAHIFLRGNPKRLGKVVARGVPRILIGGGKPPIQIKAGSGRRELAEWLADPANPLTARVMVNRVWQHHFGTGLVPTPNDFGERGERPANPALLDWLAARFVDAGWSIKALHRLIMTSSVYQQSGRADSNTLALDLENRLFGRMDRQRLDAEAIRDSLLAISDRLDTRLGGLSVSDIAAPRRTVYFQTVRTGPAANDFNRLFDRADPGSIVPVRGESTVASQALFFLNDPFVQESAGALAARVTRDEPGLLENRIRRLYQLALSRPPAAAELELGLKMLGPNTGVDSWTSYCQLILCSNEFIYLD